MREEGHGQLRSDIARASHVTEIGRRDGFRIQFDAFTLLNKTLFSLLVLRCDEGLVIFTTDANGGCPQNPRVTQTTGGAGISRWNSNRRWKKNFSW